jgi:hypothetical protein
MEIYIWRWECALQLIRNSAAHCHYWQSKPIPPYVKSRSLLTMVIPHDLLHVLTADSRLYCSTNGLLARAKDLLRLLTTGCSTAEWLVRTGLLLDFGSTVIPGSSLLWILGPNVCSLLAVLLSKLCVCCTVLSAECISAITAFRL